MQLRVALAAGWILVAAGAVHAQDAPEAAKPAE